MMISTRCAAIVILFGFLSAAISGCSSKEPTDKPSAQTYPSSEATNATTVFLNGSIVSTRIKSKRIISFAEQDSSWAFVLNVDFYDSSGQHTSTLRADSALIRETQHRLEVFGDVHVNTDQGTTLTSQHLAWNDSSRIITTDSLVVVTRGKDVMSGYGFRSDPELTRIVFRRRVRGKLTDTKILEGEE